MAVVSVKERWQDRGGSFGAVDDFSTRREWLVTVNDKLDTPLVVYASTAGLLPRYLEPHPQNFYMTCRKLTITPEQSTWKFLTATAEYSTAPVSKEDTDRALQPNPLLRPTRVTIEGVQREKYVNKDRDGIAFTNSAGDYFPAQVVDDDRVLLALTKNVSQRFPSIFTYSNSLNASAYTVDGITVPKKTGKIGRFRYSELQEENGFSYYVLTSEVQVRPAEEDWYISIMDEGFNYLKSGVKTKILIPNDNGDLEPATESVPLNGSGSILEENDPRFGEEGVSREWEYYAEKDWSQLPF